MGVLNEAIRILFIVSPMHATTRSEALEAVKPLFRTEVTRNGFENIADDTYRYIQQLSSSCSNLLSEECDLFVGLYNHLLYLSYFDFTPQNYDYNELVACLYRVRKNNRSSIGLSVEAAKNSITRGYWDNLISSVQHIVNTPKSKKISKVAHSKCLE